MSKVKITKEKENELRELIAKQEVLRDILKKNGICTSDDPESILRTANFFYHVKDYTKWLEYCEKIIDDYPYSKECMIVGQNLRVVKKASE